MNVADFVFEFLQESHRILPGNEGVAGIHIHAQVWAVYKSQHFFHELGLGGVKTMGFDIDDHLVAFGDFHDLSISIVSSFPAPGHG